MSGNEELQNRRVAMAERVRQAMEAALPLKDDRCRPYVTLTYAQSLDGSIARNDGEKLLLSNVHSQRLTHQVRAMHEAILVGINTVLTDDPRLNVRLVEGRNPQPVVVDTRLRFPLDASLLRDPCVRPIIATGESTACLEKERRLTELGARVLRLPLESDGSLCLARLFTHLRSQGIQTVMVEGGSEIITSILSSHLADQFLLTIAPRFVGGLRAVRTQEDVAADRWPALSNIDYEWLAGDLVIRGDLVSPETDDTSLPSAVTSLRSPIVHPRE